MYILCPEPLKKSLQEELLKLYYENKSLEVRNVLIEHNLRLVFMVVNKFNNYGEDEKQEFFSEGCLGLIAAIENYSPKRGIPFSCFANICIVNKIKNYISKIKKYYAKYILIDTEPSDLSFCSNDLVVDALIQKNLCMEVWGVINSKLKARKVTCRTGLIIKCFLKGFTAKEIAEIAGVSTSRVYQVKRKYIMTIEIKKAIKGE